ncbi:unnamed protein product [marine sediment metagenome]|uniref:JAB domain-containing protein n=1 Tax=marine sediment metagenome TaxID=412755 RepID=X1NLP0_9ZZZZ
MREICYILIGKRIGRFWLGRLVKKTTGTASSVEFDWAWVLRREEEKGDVLGFWHTHEKKEIPSDRDVETMGAWVDCFYKPLLCIIESSFRKQGFSVMHVEVKRTQGILVAWFPFPKIYKFFRFVIATGQK